MKVIIVLEIETSKNIANLDKLVQNRAYTLDGVEDVKIIKSSVDPVKDFILNGGLL